MTDQLTEVDMLTKERIGQLVGYWTAKFKSHQLWPEGQGLHAEAVGRVYADTIAALKRMHACCGEEPGQAEREEYARVRCLDDQQIIHEAMSSPIQLMRELANRYDVVIEKLEGFSMKGCCDNGACSKCYTGPVTTLTDEQRYEAHVQMEREAHAQENASGTQAAV